MAKARHTTQRDITATHKARLALELRKTGLTLDEIACQCGYSNRSGAFQAIKRELDRIPVEDAVDLRKIELMRLEQLTSIVFPVVVIDVVSEEDDKEEQPVKKTKVNLFAVDRLLAISERRAKLMGLDTPIDSTINANVVVVREVPEGYLEVPKA